MRSLKAVQVLTKYLAAELKEKIDVDGIDRVEVIWKFQF